MSVISSVWGKRVKFLIVIEGDGGLVNLDGTTLRFSAKLAATDPDPAPVSKVSGSGIVHDAEQAGAGMGKATLEISRADTIALHETMPASPFRAVWQLELVDSLIMEEVDPFIVDAGEWEVLLAVRQGV